MYQRRYAVGPELVGTESVSLRVWAPDHHTVTAVVDSREWPLEPEADGYFGATVQGSVGTTYGFRLDGQDEVLADPASKAQPGGVFALSSIWDPSTYRWSDHAWRGLALPGQVLYEMHVGTFTPEGTWAAAMQHLPRLAALGVTCVQMMPINAFAGGFGWGYDGVFWLAPTAAYGTHEDLQRFIDRAHQNGLGVILDVVFNHLGPAGNVLPRYTRHYLSDRRNEWGESIRFDKPCAHGVRDLVLTAGEYWIREFHVDGFRIDAAQQIVDGSAEHILAALTRTARRVAAPRTVIVVGEHEPQHAVLIRPVDAGGYGLDAIFHEDLHHSLAVALTGMREAYLSDYSGSSREWLAAVRGPLYQGQYYPWQAAPRGLPALEYPPRQWLAFIENHDQVANLADGARLRDLTSPAWWRAMSALILLGPWTPLLFQGQEWGSRRPFRYFVDHDDELQAAVQRGRHEFMAQFSRLRDHPLPADPASDIGAQAFKACALEHPEHADDVAEWRLHRDALALRRQLSPSDIAPLASTLTDRLLLIRYPAGAHARERLLVVNLGADLDIGARPDPLLGLAPSEQWAVEWCSESPLYGGKGAVHASSPHAIVATGHATTLFIATTRT